MKFGIILAAVNATGFLCGIGYCFNSSMVKKSAEMSLSVDIWGHILETSSENLRKISHLRKIKGNYI